MKTKLRKSHAICLPFEKNRYDGIIKAPKTFRGHVDGQWSAHPELFVPGPDGSGLCHAMKDIRSSKKLGIAIRRITVSGTDYSICPSFAMPYMGGFATDAEQVLYCVSTGYPSMRWLTFSGAARCIGTGWKIT